MPGTNPWLKKKNPSRQRNVKARTRWLGGRAGLPKSSEDSSNVLFGVLTSGIPVLFQGPMASSPYIARGLFSSMVIEGVHIPGPFALNVLILSTLDPDFDARPSFAMASEDHSGSVEMSSSPKR